MRTVRMTPLLVLVLALLSGGCAWMQGRSPNGANAVVGWKTVMDKVPPAYLIATDRAQCTVTAQRFSEVREGDNVFCAWQPAVAGPERPVPGPEVGAPRDANQPRLPPAGRPPPP